MTDISVSDSGVGVVVTVTAQNGETASAVAIGMDVEEVRERSSNIVDAHNLIERAEQDGNS